MATYYWRGGSGTWNNVNTANWSNSSGGAGGFGPPTREDIVIFDTNSAAGNYTVQCGTTSLCARITATAPAAGAGNITFSNTVENGGVLIYCGSTTGALTTTVNIYNGAIFTAGSNGAGLSVYCYATGTSTITFNGSGAATQPVSIFISQGSNGAYSNTVNFCNGATQTFSSVSVYGGATDGFPSSATYNTFNCTTATISILGGSNGYEAFTFGFPQSSGALEFAGNVVLTSTTITIGAAAQLSTAAFGGLFCMNATSGGTLSCAGTNISILRPPISAPSFLYYFYISPSYTCSTQLGSVTLSNGYNTVLSSYSAGFGNVPGLSGNFTASNTVVNPSDLYLSISLIHFNNFTISGTTTIRSVALMDFNGIGSPTFTHTGAVSLIGSALGMSYYRNLTGGAISFGSTITSTNPTNFAANHRIGLNSAPVTVAGNVNLVDTYFESASLTTTGASNTWTHGTVNGLPPFTALNGAFIADSISLAKGLTTLTNTYYVVNGFSVNASFAGLTLAGSSLTVYTPTTYAGNVTLSPYSTISLSELTTPSSSVTITGTLTSTNAGAIEGFHFLNLGSLSVSSTVNIVDTKINTANVVSGAYTHVNNVASAIAQNNFLIGFSAAGAISLTRANYYTNGIVSANSGAGNLSLSLSLLDTSFGNILCGILSISGSTLYTNSSLNATAVTVPNNGTTYSTVTVNGTATITSLASTSSSTGAHGMYFGTLVASSTVNLVDTVITVGGNLNSGAYTHTNAVGSPAISQPNSIINSGIFTATGAINITRASYSIGSNVNASSTVTLVDTIIDVAGNLNSGAYTHTNTVGSSESFVDNDISGLFTTTGAISLTNARYYVIGAISASSGAANLSLSLANLYANSSVTVAALSVSGSVLTMNGALIATAVTVPNNVTTYSSISGTSATITSLDSTSTSGTSGYHYISFVTIAASSAINLADTAIYANGGITSGPYTHTNTVGAVAISISNDLFSLVTTSGSIQTTRATYNVSGIVDPANNLLLAVGSIMGAGSVAAAAVSITGSALRSYGALTATAVTMPNSGATYSSLIVDGTTTITSLSSTSTNTGSHSVALYGAFATTGLVSLVDTTFYNASTTNVATTWTQTKTATGEARSTNVFGDNATFGGNTAFTNSDVVFGGQTNAVTGTFSFTVTSAANLVSQGSYLTNDLPGLAFINGGVFSVSGSFTVTGAAAHRTNVRTFLPVSVGDPTTLTYNQVTIGVGSVSLSFVNFQNVSAVGATPWTGTSLGNATGNTGITFATGVTRFLVATSGTVQSNTAIWANSSGGATSINNYPLPQDTIAVDNNSASTGAVDVNFASVVYATNVVAQASVTNFVTFTRSDRSSLVLLGNVQLFAPTAGGLVFSQLNIILDNASSAAAHVLSWPTGYVPIVSNNVYLFTYSLGAMTLSGSTASSNFFAGIKNVNQAPVSGSYGTFTISDGIETWSVTVEIGNTTPNSNNFTSSTIYTTVFNVAATATTAYTLSAPTSLGALLTLVNASYVGILNLATATYGGAIPSVTVPSIGTLNISVFSPANLPSSLRIASCTVGNMTGGGINSSNQIYLYGNGGGAGTLTKVGGGFVQLTQVRPFNLSAAPANTFYATNSSLAPGGTATGWTFSAAPGGAAGGNFFLEF